VFACLQIPGETPAMVHRAAVLASLTVAALVPLGDQRGGRPLALALAVAALGVGALCMQAGSAKFAVLAVGLGAANGLIGVLGWPTGIAFRSGAIATAVALVAAIAALGRAYDYDTVPGWCWWVPVLAPLALLLAELPPMAGRPRVAALLRWVAPSVLVAAAVAVAMWPKPAPADGGSSEPTPSVYG
jgi:hypothetical protein